MVVFLIMLKYTDIYPYKNDKKIPISRYFGFRVIIFECLT